MAAGWILWFAALLPAACVATARAGGSGLNVAVVVNSCSTDSVRLGNYYCERRQVPPQNLIRIAWPGGNTEWTRAECESVLLGPLSYTLAARGLTGQVEVVVLAMDIPYRVVQPGPPPDGGQNSTTSVLFYGFKPDEPLPVPGAPASCSLPAASLNPYAAAEAPFRDTTASNHWLAFMITATNLAEARAIVDRGVAADGTFPTQAVFLTKSSDPARNVRYRAFDNAILENRVLGCVNLVRTNANSPTAQGLQLGSQNGYHGFGLTTNLFVPGAMADNLTSFGGWLFENACGMTRVPDFLAAGATASYGTVVEPCNWPDKFPSPLNYFYQARGFTIAECYYQSLTNPFQGVLVGEPLAAPFARPPQVSWLTPPADTSLRGSTNLTVHVAAPDPSRPVGRVDLFVDGRFWQTLTNIGPAAGNVLTVTLAGTPMTCVVPTNASLGSLAAAVAGVINAPEHTNLTRVHALVHGDRLELRSFEMGRPGAAVAMSAESASGSAPARTTFLRAARPSFVEEVVYGIRSCLVTNLTTPDAYLQLVVLKTNGATTTLAVTNSAGHTNPAPLVEALVKAINTHPDLLQADGVAAEDFIEWSSLPGAEFNLRARTPGWPAAQIQVTLGGSTNLAIQPEGTVRLDENIGDLMPRNHLYLTAGVTNLTLEFPLDTTALADGWHELEVVAYEGSHVRTAGRAARRLRVANGSLSATLTTLVGGSNTLVTTTLAFAVEANTNAVARIDLLGTGGLLASVSNQPTAIIELPGTNLDLGLHPLCALVTGPDGAQYRTETVWVRLVEETFPEPPFALQAGGPPLKLSWPATVGRRYAVWSATELAGPFEVRAQFTATNSPASWAESEPLASARFYRVSASP